jgi:threonine/homoserine/homoserine lactone efflux protein
MFSMVFCRKNHGFCNGSNFPGAFALLQSYIPLITFAMAATISPGGTTSLATASGLQFGYVRSLPLIFGIASALALLVAVSGTGLGTIILA